MKKSSLKKIIKSELREILSNSDRYERIVFMQGDEADEPLKILDEKGEDAALNYLMQWYEPGQHEMSNMPSHGTQDKKYEKNGFIMSWNPYIGYIGLEYDTEWNGKDNVKESIISKTRLNEIIKEEIIKILEYNHGNPSYTDGEISFPSKSMKALWLTELLGQMSDGMWENSKPYDHWEFWSDLHVVDGPGEVKTRYPYRIKKNSYNFIALIPVVGDRMINTGKMGQFTEDEEALNGAKYMPETYDEWLSNKKTNRWEHSWIKKYMSHVDDRLAKEFYESSYDVNDLKNDLRDIKKAMKNVKTI